MKPMQTMRGKDHLVQLAITQQQDPIAKDSAEVTSARSGSANLAWSHRHALKQGRSGGLIDGSGKLTHAGQQHF